MNEIARIADEIRAEVPITWDSTASHIDGLKSDIAGLSTRVDGVSERVDKVESELDRLGGVTFGSEDCVVGVQ